MIITIIFTLIALAAFINAQMDALYRDFDSSLMGGLNPEFWNPYVSHGQKWKNGDKSQGERYLGSSTVFVWLTDGWHLLKTIFLGLLGIVLFVTMFFYEPTYSYYDFIPVPIAYFLFFELGLRLKRKN